MSRNNGKAEQRTFIPIPYETINAFFEMDERNGYEFIRAVLEYGYYGTEPSFSKGDVKSIVFNSGTRQSSDRLEFDFYQKAVKGGYKNENPPRPPFDKWLDKWLKELAAPQAVKDRIKEPLKELRLNYDEPSTAKSGADAEEWEKELRAVNGGKTIAPPPMKK